MTSRQALFTFLPFYLFTFKNPFTLNIPKQTISTKKLKIAKIICIFQLINVSLQHKINIKQ